MPKANSCLEFQRTVPKFMIHKQLEL
jgi:hypothetical protein